MPHVFLTRFNLPANRVEQSIFSDEWLRERVGLWERFTIPSVRAQVGENIHWIMYCDQSTPDWLREKMDALVAEGLASPRYLDRALTPETIADDIRAEVGQEATLVSTSNLDNDDGLAHDFVLRTRRTHSGRAPEAVYLSVGLIMHGGAVYLRHDPINAFSAVVDDLSRPSFKTAWSGQHNVLEQQMPASRVDGPPAWLQVVHGKNVSNRLRGRLTSPRDYGHLFEGLIDDLAEPHAARLRRDHFVDAPIRDARERVVPTLRKLGQRVLGSGGYDELKVRLRRNR